MHLGTDLLSLRLGSYLPEKVVHIQRAGRSLSIILDSLSLTIIEGEMCMLDSSIEHKLQRPLCSAIRKKVLDCALKMISRST